MILENRHPFPHWLATELLFTNIKNRKSCHIKEISFIIQNAVEARSYNLISLDDFLWGYVQTHFYKNNSQSTSELKDHIINSIV